MIKSIAIALVLTCMNLSEFGFALIGVWLFTGMVCLQYEWTRNIMIGCYIVGGFWVMAAGAM